MNKHPPQFFISLYGWTFWVPILVAGVVAMVVCGVVGWWWIFAGFAVLTVACLAFYRDFHRAIPSEDGVMVAPADGKVTEVSEIEFYEPFGGAALKVSIFLSVFDVHVNRSPCEGKVLWSRYEEGLFLDARHPDCSAKNQSNTICLGEV
ncbi:MAG: phosphatidylserine decarboxylase, partial [Phycisphaerales bacterium]|nr:phosphatidylserine decarboxylase [Phycisphaerales bacterium]